MRAAALVFAASLAALLSPSAAGAACPPEGCTQDVTIDNRADNHAESHADNGGLSSNGGRITLQPSRSAADSRQHTANRQRMRASRHTRPQQQGAALVNWVHNNAAATSANTGESSGNASTRTGATDSGVGSTQTISNAQTVEVSG